MGSLFTCSLETCTNVPDPVFMQMAGISKDPDSPWIELSDKQEIAGWQLFWLYRATFKSIARHEARRGARVTPPVSGRVTGREHFPYLRWDHFTLAAALHGWVSVGQGSRGCRYIRDRERAEK